MTDKGQGGNKASGSTSVTEGAITFADLGIPTGEGGMVHTPVGQRRSIKDVTLLEWIFLCLSTVSILIVIGLTIDRLVELVLIMNDSTTTAPTSPFLTSPYSNSSYPTSSIIPIGSTDPLHDSVQTDITFAILLLFNAVFILFYVYNGVFGERANELLVFVAGIFVVLIYCIINYTVTGSATVTGSTTQRVKLMRLILICVAGPPLSLMALFIAKKYYNSRNLIFRTVGANIELQDMCQYMFLCLSLLKFDLQLEISMVILILENGVGCLELLEQLVIGIGVAYGVLWALICYLSLRYESKKLTWLFFITSVFEPAYIIYKIVTVAQNIDKNDSLLHYAIIVCGVLGLVVRSGLVLCMAKVYSNFGRGLKEKAFGADTGEDTSPIDPSPVNTAGSLGYQGLE